LTLQANKLVCVFLPSLIFVVKAMIITRKGSIQISF
jgi:hypothetical protein